MLARIWRGTTHKSKAAEYAEYIRQTGVKEYRATPGNLGVWILQNESGDVAEFLVLTFWESLEAIRAFAGDNVEAAKYYPEDTKFLLHLEPHVTHYQVPVAIAGVAQTAS